MGVKGLTSFIEQHHNLLQEYQLHDTRVIIDGYGCMFYLYSAHLDHGHHGGEYETYADKCHSFFTNLLKCNITPYVVFDGAYDLDDKKLSTLRSRCQDRIKIAGNISEGRSGYLLPVLAEYVLKKVMNDLEVPSATCDFEADHEIAALANTWNCPVLGRDSDFFVMEIKAGYLQLEMLDWMHIRKKGGKTNDKPAYKYLSSTKYTLARFCKHFSIKKELVGLIATVTGNDYVDPVCINQFLMQIYQRPKRGKNTAKKHGHLSHVLDWLADQTTMEECLQRIMGCVKMDQRQKVRLALETSLSMYIPSDHSKLAQYFTKNFLPSSFDAFSGAHIAIPHWCLVSHRRGYMPSTVINIMCTRRLFGLTQVENHGMPSSNEPARPLREILYGMLSRQHDERSKGQSERSKGQSSSQVVDSAVRRRDCKKLTVVEYDRRGRQVKCNEVAPSYQVSKFGIVIPIEDVPKVSQATRVRLIQSALGIEQERSQGRAGVNSGGCGTLPTCFHFPLFVIIYWLSHADPKANVNHLRALLLCWVYCLAKHSKRNIPCQDASSDGAIRTPSYPRQDNKEVETLLNNFRVNVDPKIKSYTLDLEAAHGFAQMQSCLKSAMHLNATLQFPYPEPDVTLLYSGRLVHCLYGILKGIPGGEGHQLSWIQSNLCDRAPTSLALYNAMYHFVMSSIGSEMLYVAPPKKRKRRGGHGGRGRGRGRSQQGQGSQQGQMCNKFTGLVLEGDVGEDEDDE